MVKRIPVYVTPAEVHRMMELARDPTERLLVEMLWYTGARVSEVLAVRAGDVTDTGVILPNLKQKQPEQKHVILPEEFLGRLKAKVKDLPPSALLFESPVRPGRPITRVWAYKVIKRLAAQAGVIKGRYRDREATPAWPHTFRHGYATALILQRVPLTAVQRQLGHKGVGNTAVYTQIADPQIRDILNQVKL